MKTCKRNLLLFSLPVLLTLGLKIIFTQGEEKAIEHSETWEISNCQGQKAFYLE
jgi:hypothetical protein